MHEGYIRDLYELEKCGCKELMKGCPTHNCRFDRSRASFCDRMGLLCCILTIPFWIACSNSPGDLNESASFGSASANQGIEFFDGGLDEALNLARRDDKHIFVHSYTTWCGPCIVMQETVFLDPAVGEYFNERFISLKSDLGEAFQDASWEDLARNGIGVVPIHAILDSEENPKGLALGSASPTQLISIMQRLLGTVQSTFDTMQDSYDSGERSPEFIQKYLKSAIVEFAIRDIDDQKRNRGSNFFEERAEYKIVADEYFSSRPYSQLINETDAQLVMYFREQSPRGDDLVEFVIDHFEEFLNVTSTPAMALFILNATLEGAKQSALDGDKTYERIIDELETYPLQAAVKYERNRNPDSLLLPKYLKEAWEIDILRVEGDWDAIFRVYAQRFRQRGAAATDRDYQRASRNLIQSDNPIHRETAIEYGQRAYALDDTDPQNFSAYFVALFADGRILEAREIMQEYSSKGNDSESVAELLATLDQMTSVLTHEESKASNVQN